MKSPETRLEFKNAISGSSDDEEVVAIADGKDLVLSIIQQESPRSNSRVDDD